MVGKSTHVLVVDDDRHVCEALGMLLRTDGHAVTVVDGTIAAVRAVETESFDLALLDLNYASGATSGRDGLDLLQQMQRLDPTLPIIVMTAWSTVASAVEAMSIGARDYIEKPWDDQRLLTSIRTHVRLRRALATTVRLEEAHARLRDRDAPPFIATSPAMRQVLGIIDRVAGSDASVLITGEHGTGKEVVASTIHRASMRKSRPFITMNAGGLAQGVAESELFGHVRGAYTDAKEDRAGCFELADEGTLFLDEIGNMPASMQPKLLRVLQTGEVQRLGSSRVQHVNVRVLSATNADLRTLISSGGFREDLLYRLNTIRIDLPPLRSRREDILPLAEFYVKRFEQKYQRGITGLRPDARDALLAHSWPGNVRELCHVIERGILMSDAEAIHPQALGLESAGTDDAADPLAAVQDALISDVIAQNAGDVTRAAKQLGISRSALYRRLQRRR